MNIGSVKFNSNYKVIVELNFLTPIPGITFEESVDFYCCWKNLNFRQRISGKLGCDTL